LLVSLLLHLVVLSQKSGFHLLFRGIKDKTPQLKYVKSENPSNNHDKKMPAHRDQEQFLKLPSKITINDQIPPQFSSEERNDIRIKSQEILLADSAVNKPAFIKAVNSGSSVLKKTISLPPIDMDKSGNPSYISYYQIVREKIRRSAYQNHNRNEEGEVYLSFIVSSDGALKAVKVIEEKSLLTPYLKETALRSINQATPFPDFPKELNYPQLSFNVLISFKLE
jgi:TonB family protein